MCHINVDNDYPSKPIRFLVQYNVTALDHPIQAAASGRFRCMPEAWISWASKSDHRWKEIMAVLRSNEFLAVDSDMPADLYCFIEESRSTPLPRTPFFVPENDPPVQMHAVSPKKLHEVFTMSSYITTLFAGHPIRPLVVDIGAGQGYLSRALSSNPNNFHVLALDSDDNQTVGSITRKDWNSMAETEATTSEITSMRGSLTQKTVFIGDATSLTSAINDWIQNELAQHRSPNGQSSLPIVLVGLHCCGDLTPSILRFIQYSLQTSNNLFNVVGCVVVGCCYNMCRPTSFPLSKVVSTDIARLGPLSLETQHLHLATQSPLMWDMKEPSDGPLSSSSAALAVRKVTYRALLARRLPPLCRPEGDTSLCTDVDWRQKRVGRLRGSAYQDFPTYLRVARGKLGLEASSTSKRTIGQEVPFTVPGTLEEGNTSSQEAVVQEYDLESDLSSEELRLSRTLEVLYVLRCLLGPIVESLIAVDRYLFLQEVINENFSHGEDTNASDISVTNRGSEGGGLAQLVNIFDQSTGSQRNLALVWVRSGV